MQGIAPFIPTEVKIKYINLLAQVGFDTLDFGSFVSLEAIPQLADTADVVEGLDLAEASTRTKFLAIVANLRGAKDALKFEEIEYLGFPFSLSETFQKRNTNKTQNQALDEIREIQFQCKKSERKLVVYLSMGFGNPYGDKYDEAMLETWTSRITKLGVTIISLADTVGTAAPDAVERAFRQLIPAYPDVEFGAHLHAKADAYRDKLSAAWEAGCHRFDGALRGFGGCPLAEDELVGNIATEHLISFLEEKKVKLGLNMDKLKEAQAYSKTVFGK